MINDVQQHRLDEWAAHPDVHRMDVIGPLDGGAYKAHMFAADRLKNTVSGETEYELMAIGIVQPDGEWELHGPTNDECATIMPIEEES
jgi:hypothetical protein